MSIFSNNPRVRVTPLAAYGLQMAPNDPIDHAFDAVQDQFSNRTNGTLFYLGCGFIAHLALRGAAIDPTSALSWALVLAWPVVIIVGVVAIMAVMVAVPVIIGLGWVIAAAIYSGITGAIEAYRRGRGP